MRRYFDLFSINAGSRQNSCAFFHETTENNIHSRHIYIHIILKLTALLISIHIIWFSNHISLLIISIVEFTLFKALW